jgi:hypothetical protein
LDGAAWNAGVARVRLEGIEGVGAAVGKLVVLEVTPEYDFGSPDWKAKVAASKFAMYPNYGLANKGYIGIQGDHPGSLELRHIRIG